jgi:hypothetical protein
LSPAEEDVLREMEKAGATVTARDVPAATPVDLKTLLECEEQA